MVTGSVAHPPAPFKDGIIVWKMRATKNLLKDLLHKKIVTGSVAHPPAPSKDGIIVWKMRATKNLLKDLLHKKIVATK